jgi:hypothetical protein
MDIEQPKQETRELVSLVASCPLPDKEEAQKDPSSEAFLSIKDLKMQSISLRIQHSESLEKRLLDYIKQCEGQIDVVECALKLDIPPQEVKTTLKNLDAKGKIIMET